LFFYSFLILLDLHSFPTRRSSDLGKWPGWLLVVAMVAAAVGLALLIRWKLRNAAPEVRNWRAWVVWGIQSAFVALVLFLLWQPEIGRAHVRTPVTVRSRMPSSA